MCPGDNAPLGAVKYMCSPMETIKCDSQDGDATQNQQSILGATLFVFKIEKIEM